jgi:hypothetical protein
MQRCTNLSPRNTEQGLRSTFEAMQPSPANASLAGAPHTAAHEVRIGRTARAKELTMAVDYRTFQDGNIVLPKANGDIDEDLEVATPNADTSKNGVFSIEVNPTSGTPTLEVILNSTNILTETFGNNVKRVVQENFEQSLLQASNTLTFTVTGNGSVNMSDGHLLFKTL